MMNPIVQQPEGGKKKEKARYHDQRPLLLVMGNNNL